MEKKKGKKKIIWICVAVAVVAAAVFLVTRLLGGGTGKDVVYVTSVSEITGIAANGLNNKYAGVVEAEDSWSAALNADLSVKEVMVSVGQEVKAGDPLFSYDLTEVGDSLGSAKIDLERLNNELAALKDSISDLSAQRDATSDENTKAQYSVELQQAQLDVTSKQYEISSKREEIAKLEETIQSGTVTSEIDGVVKSIGGEEDGSDDGSYITVISLNAFRIRGEVNEQNVASLSEGMNVIVYSRVDSAKYWKGTITKLDTGSTSESSADDIDTSSIYSSSSYSFYVSVEDSSELNMGQHVYIELDQGQLDGEKSGLWLEEYYIDLTDADAPAVWVDAGGSIARRKVTLGDYDETLMKYEILSGLEASDAIAVPYEGMKEGMATVLSDADSEDDYLDEELFEDLDEIDDMEEDAGDEEISDEDWEEFFGDSLEPDTVSEYEV